MKAAYVVHVANLIECGKCSLLMNEASHEISGKRQPCPECGATIRRFNVQVSDTSSCHDSLKFKNKTASGKVLREGFGGDDLQYRTGKWMQKHRLIDHENNLYEEVVVNPETGDVIHFCKEPLTEHKGHGSDKKDKQIR